MEQRECWVNVYWDGDIQKLGNAKFKSREIADEYVRYAKERPAYRLHIRLKPKQD